MEPRYQEPPELAADPELITRYVQIANDNSEPEDKRSAASAALVDLYRLQRLAVEAGEAQSIDYRLVLFIRESLRRCAEDLDPLRAAEVFLARPRRGRGKPRQPHRDFVIAGDVAARIQQGESTDGACAAVAELADLSDHEVRRIYFAQKKADPAALAVDLDRRRAEREALMAIKEGQ
jgi:hypothetical protein